MKNLKLNEVQIVCLTGPVSDGTVETGSPQVYSVLKGSFNKEIYFMVPAADHFADLVPELVSVTYSNPLKGRPVLWRRRRSIQPSHAGQLYLELFLSFYLGRNEAPTHQSILLLVLFSKSVKCWRHVRPQPA